MPATVAQIRLFVANCYKLALAAATVTTYKSPLSYFHKIGGKQDPTQNLLIKRLLQGYKK